MDKSTMIVTEVLS